MPDDPCWHFPGKEAPALSPFGRGLGSPPALFGDTSFAYGEIVCHIRRTMKGERQYRRDGRVRLCALVVAFHLASFALVAPMLVLCQDGDTHRAVESAIALCCSPGKAESSDVIRLQPAVGSTDNGCAGSCTDTPLLTSIDATAPKSFEPASAAVALAPPVTLAPCPAPAFSGQDAELLSAVSSPHLSRSTVLRI